MCTMGANTSSKNNRAQKDSFCLPDPAVVNNIMTLSQKRLIVYSWEKSAHHGFQSIGERIFLRVFQISPELKRLFGLENISEAVLKQNNRFQRHASTFSRVLSLVVRNVDDLSQIDDYLKDLGRKHVIYKERGFQAEYWEVFAQAMMECVLMWEKRGGKKEKMKAWRILISYVVTLMRDGYDEQAKMFYMRHESAYSFT